MASLIILVIFLLSISKKKKNRQIFNSKSIKRWL
ncbi:MAG: hypothetical protein MRECE_10c012 [Mycoplasmataceae bacterium CE_OT135]|nr:MAG: hypothetical protein MRECE_15c002 [Mycoplasmataceae bacterium CE_OT135]KLL03710.1 MAG: hypothetical protein MRECE_10c012 [Mycoplasmataceae bacterium CE_OT135]